MISNRYIHVHVHVVVCGTVTGLLSVCMQCVFYWYDYQRNAYSIGAEQEQTYLVVQHNETCLKGYVNTDQWA